MSLSIWSLKQNNEFGTRWIAKTDRWVYRQEKRQAHRTLPLTEYHGTRETATRQDSSWYLRPNPRNTRCMGPCAGVDYVTSPYVDSRVDSNTCDQHFGIAGNGESLWAKETANLCGQGNGGGSLRTKNIGGPLWAGKRRTFVGRETADLCEQSKGGPLWAGKRQTFMSRETANLCWQGNGGPFTSKMIRDGGNYEAYRLCMTPWATPYIASWRGNKLEETSAF